MQIVAEIYIRTSCFSFHTRYAQLLHRMGQSGSTRVSPVVHKNSSLAMIQLRFSQITLDWSIFQYKKFSVLQIAYLPVYFRMPVFIIGFGICTDLQLAFRI